MGNDAASALFIRQKERAARRIGVECVVVHMPADTNAAELFASIQEANASPNVDGIVVQRPLPAHIDARHATDAVIPRKDVDGATTQNAGCAATGTRPLFDACAAAAVLRILRACNVPIGGARVAVVGRGAGVGLPLTLALIAADATVTLCHTLTANIAAETGRADILVAATGTANLVNSHWVRPGAVVVDVGTSVVSFEDNQKSAKRQSVCGDVVLDAAMLAKAAVVVPVPGGVGPVTVATLLENVVLSAERKEAQLKSNF